MALPSSRAGTLPARAKAKRLQYLSLPHIASFDYCLDTGLALAAAALPPRDFALRSGLACRLWLEDVEVGTPLKEGGAAKLWPAECRERGSTYAAPLTATVCRRVGGASAEVLRTPARLGNVPIMVRSRHCHLAGLAPAALVRAGEEALEFGGYFICNGIERIIRMLQVPKRNFPAAVERGAFANRGPLYSTKAVVMRSARPDQSSSTLTLHYLEDGGATVRMAVRKQEFFLPVVLVLRALVDTTDHEIYERVLAGDRANTYLSDRVLMLLREAKRYGTAAQSRSAALAYLGSRFRGVVEGVSASLPDVEVGQALLDCHVLVHIESEAARDKFEVLVLMLRKLYAFVAGSVLEDNSDSLANQELLLPGHLLLAFLKEKLSELLQGIEAQVLREDTMHMRLEEAKAAHASAQSSSEQASAEAASARSRSRRRPRPAGDNDDEEDRVEEESGTGRVGDAVVDDDDVDEGDEGFAPRRRARPAGKRRGSKRLDTPAAAAAAGAAALAALPRAVARAAAVDLLDSTWFRKVVERQPEVGRKVYYLLATGNLVSSTGLDMMQVSGYSVVADKINFLRFTTHFRSVHRGQFFAEMKTTTVRKLLPENWGFLCPVHTPDGGPCGLLNHLAGPATVVAQPVHEGDFALVAARAAETHAVGSIDGSNERRGAAPSFAASMASLLVALGMVQHTASGGVLPATHLPVLLDGKVVGSAAPHAAFRISRALRRAKALGAHVRAQVDGVQGATPHAQADAIAELLRSATLGLSSVFSGSATADDDGDEDFPRSLEGLGRLGVVPPSLEVAFIPPPWWEAEVDAILVDAAADARAARCGLFGGTAAGAGGAAALSAGTKAAGLGNDGAPVKLVGLFPGLFLSSAPQRLVRPVLQLDTGLVELVSPLEQPFMDIAALPEDLEDILHQPLAAAGGAAAAVTTAEDAAMLAAAAASTGSVGGKGKKSRKSSVAIAAVPAARPPSYSHIELSATAMLSELASLTPFSDMNQSPRNMYQCQMAKQTMGTPLHSWPRRTDTKLFRLTTPQAPLVQNAAQARLGLDEYPNGANACVAVISYTGFDMEDACIINKSSFERGFGWASVYKTYEFDLMADRPASDAARFAFHNLYSRNEHACGKPPAGTAAFEALKRQQLLDLKELQAGPLGAAATLPRPAPPREGERVCLNLDSDGLPGVGLLVVEGDPLYCYIDVTTGAHKVVRHKDIESAYVDEVRLLGAKAGGGGATAAASGSDLGPSCVSIKLRFDRRPVVGDKFSSRHGQKGVLSYLWPCEDMPFSAGGMSPDVIINPHAFPSRMTIGMLVESMAGKAGALRGAFQSSTPFRFNERQRAVDYFGEQLAASGYDYAGTETFYSGVTGEPLRCDVFFGVVYYQRLRHMVKDKAQVRSTGPINALTRQPVQGRKKGGGVRFGEMERDSLLAHGASFLLNDRLMNSSDRHVALVCGRCGSILAPLSVPAETAVIAAPAADAAAAAAAAAPAASSLAPVLPGVPRGRRQPLCRQCGDGEAIRAVAVPYVFRYLANELAGMGIRISCELG